MSNRCLDSQTIFLTGASRGIGAALAENLADAGAAVVLFARDGAKLKEIASRIINRGGRAVIMSGDVAAPEALANAVKEAALSGWYRGPGQCRGYPAAHLAFRGELSKGLGKDHAGEPDGPGPGHPCGVARHEGQAAGEDH